MTDCIYDNCHAKLLKYFTVANFVKLLSVFEIFFLKTFCRLNFESDVFIDFLTVCTLLGHPFGGMNKKEAIVLLC